MFKHEFHVLTIVLFHSTVRVCFFWSLRLKPTYSIRVYDNTSIVRFLLTGFCLIIDFSFERANMTDFDRFKLQKAKSIRNRLVRVELAKLKKAARKA